MADPFSVVPLPELGRAEDADTFRLRVDRYGPELLESLRAVHGEEAESLLERVLALLAAGLEARPRELRVRDERRLLHPDWAQRPEALAYVADADRFAGTFAGVVEHLDYLSWMGVTHLELGPVLRTRDGEDDDGSAISDHRAVQARLGTLTDLEHLAAELRQRDMSLGIDLVVNHVADQHEWVQRARAGDRKYRSYFLLFQDRAEPDAWERTVPRVASSPATFTWDEAAQSWVWTTFREFEWDLNWANPDVFCEFVEILVLLANAGVEVFRLGGLPNLWKRMGTTCVNQPEVHHLTRALRAALRVAAPVVSFLATALPGPGDAPQYLGTRTQHGRLSDVVAHEDLAAQLWSALASHDTRLAEVALSALPPKPAFTTLAPLVRGRDELRWLISDDDARRASIDGYSHRVFLSSFYSGEFPGSFARGRVAHAVGAANGRVSGTTASLAGLEAALEARDPFRVDDAIRRILLLYTVALGFGGMPLLAMGDEIGILNEDRPDGSDPVARLHRPRMDWETAARAGAAWESGEVPYLPDADDRADATRWSGAAAARLYADFQHLIAVRASTPHLHAAVESRVVPSPDSRLLILERTHPLGAMVQVYNFSEQTVELSCDLLRGHLGVVADERLTGYQYSLMPWTLSIDPYRALWFTQKV